MKGFLGAMLATVLVSGFGSSARGDDNDVKAILDKAIHALGGEAKLRKADAIAWRATGKSYDDGNESSFTNETTAQGLDRVRMETEYEIGGNHFKGVTVINRGRAWSKNGNVVNELEGVPLANIERNLYLLVIPITIVPLKGDVFLVRPAGEKTVGDRPAVGLEVTGRDGKDFTLYLDKESGLPVHLVAKFRGAQGNEWTQEATFGEYKDFDGIKRATRIERRRNGVKMAEQKILEFKVLDKVGPETFVEPR
jgi:hypothetical protein